MISMPLFHDRCSFLFSFQVIVVKPLIPNYSFALERRKKGNNKIEMECTIEKQGRIVHRSGIKNIKMKTQKKLI